MSDIKEFLKERSVEELLQARDLLASTQQEHAQKCRDFVNAEIHRRATMIVAHLSSMEGFEHGW